MGLAAMLRHYGVRAAASLSEVAEYNTEAAALLRLQGS